MANGGAWTEAVPTHPIPLFHCSCADPAVGADAPSPPAASPLPASASGDAEPSAGGVPGEEPAPLDDQTLINAQPPLNGALVAAAATTTAPSKRPHSPTQEDLAKRPRDSEVGRVGPSGQ